MRKGKRGPGTRSSPLAPDAVESFVFVSDLVLSLMRMSAIM